MQLLFWILFFLAGYSYFAYPLLLKLLPAKQRSSPGLVRSYEPDVTLIIPAYNESARISDKIDNALAIDYPAEKLQIIVASDASDDGTDIVVASFADRGVQLVRAPQRRGKEFAQSLAIAQAAGEIIVFSDVSTIIPEDSIRNMVALLADPAVGAVSSEDVILDNQGQRSGESSYVRYEMWLRRLESSRSSLIGLSGSFFAARRAVCEQWDYRVPGDFNVAINCSSMGYVAISSSDVVGYYKDVADEAGEYRRKLRTVIHGFSAIGRRLEVLNPLRFGFFSIQVWSHKIMRWLVPWLGILLFLVNARLWDAGIVYQIAFLLQVIFYGLALLGFSSQGLRQHLLFKLPYYFVQVNAALLHAAILFLIGERMVSWEPSAR